MYKCVRYTECAYMSQYEETKSGSGDGYIHLSADFQQTLKVSSNAILQPET